ncbi:AEC family transporter [Salinarimonas ramus]|uniref:Transporter n=1 Tax=Salinarimonas ramus TaxID=690164 RepID=A0A917V4J9_9HYPH|nr:AEC family transporter [Salinarimonas ramus]GGK35672.1 transporter [Salinarimonas ramus]
MILEILATVAPVLAIIAIGFAWARLGLPFDSPTIGSLVLRIGTPCLIFSTLTTAEVSPAAVGAIALAAACVIAVATLVGIVVLRIAGLPLHTWLMTAMFGNTGNMGLPLCAMVFGPDGLTFGIVVFLVTSISQNTLGLVVSAGRVEVASLVRQPVVWASAVSVALLVADLRAPTWIERTTTLVGGIVIPSMLLLLGVSLAKMKVADLRIASGMAVLRLSAGAVGALATIAALGLEGAQAGVVFVMATMPAAIVSVIFAERFGRSPERIAGVIVVSTLGTLAALPVIVFVALRIAAATG